MPRYVGVQIDTVTQKLKVSSELPSPIKWDHREVRK